MIPTIRLDRLYRYKEIYGKMYIVYLDNGKIIRERNVRFYKKDVPGGDEEKEILFEVVFDEEAEKLIFRTVRFCTTLGSGELPVLRAPMTLRS